MQEQELQKPELYSNGLWFRVTLSNKTIFNTKQVEWLQQFDKYNLTKNQKQIILLGLGDKELTPNDIFKAMNISNTETEKFTQEVTVLRNYGILIELRTSQQAYKLAKKSNKSKKDIQRYKVKTP
ncbi:MAG: hypothetical protein IPN94_10875 [Sphingobacteriales bacterium]|nr:hypothetical protein [Sphingobacteriales bacterium]